MKNAIIDSTSRLLGLTDEPEQEAGAQRIVALPAPLELYPEPPTPGHLAYILDGALVWYAPEPVPLEQLKAAKNAEINAARLAANRSGFRFADGLISTDELSRSDIDGVNGTVTLTGAFPAGWPGVWKADDNSYVPLPDIQTWTQFYAAMAARGAVNFAISERLKARLALAGSSAEIEAIGWPATEEAANQLLNPTP